MRTTTYRKRTMIAYEIAESSGGDVVNILGVFHGGQNWETMLPPNPGDDSER